jgi:hypothetical protein
LITLSALLQAVTMPESYAHLFAKELLANWLRKRAVSVQVNEPGDYLMIALEPIRALVDRKDPLQGVYVEYPVCPVANGTTTLQEPWPAANIPSYAELVLRGQPPAYILDLAICQFGQIKYGIEVVHHHPVSDSKVAILQIATHRQPFELYQINASWILNQCNPPHYLQMERLIPGVRRFLPFADVTNVGNT